MGESAGAGVLALFLALLGFVLIVAGIRGTYRDVWDAVAHTSSQGDTVGSVAGGIEKVAKGG